MLDILTVAKKAAELSLTENELIILNSALNEICNGMAILEFETRIGATKQDAALLLSGISRVLDVMIAVDEKLKLVRLVTISDGCGVRYNSDCSFFGFLDPMRPQ